ncbi:MAG TPA: Wzz/FepE/Etk N-terminal domain-containing protein [Verrucomicrobiae bacterium]
MTSKPALPPPPPIAMISARDIYYIFFRHKWLIGIIALVGIVTSIVVRQMTPIYYSSQAKLMVKYIIDTQPLTSTGADAQVSSLNSGDAILNAELDMLKSHDVAEHVAQAIGPAKICPPGHVPSLTEAAYIVQGGLYADRGRNSYDITLMFSHPDPQLVVPILSQIIDSYRSEHNEVRRPNADDNLEKGIDEARRALTEAENQLAAEQKKTDIISLEDSKARIVSTVGDLKNQMTALEMDLQLDGLTLSEMKKALPPEAKEDTNIVATAPTNTPPPLSAETIREYSRDIQILQAVKNKETEELTWTTTNNPDVQSDERQIEKVEKKLREMEEANPALIAARPASATGSAPADPRIAYENVRHAAQIQNFKYGMLSNQLVEAKLQAAKIEADEAPLLDLSQEVARRRQTLDHYEMRYEEAQADATLAQGDSQISVIDKPTPAVGDFAKVNKTCNGILIGGLFLALGIPFLIEFYLDQTLKRPSDIQNRLGVPFFVSMPRIKSKAKGAALKPAKKVVLLPENAGEVPKPEAAASSPNPTPPSQPAHTNGHIAPWDPRHALRSHFETLRDRLTTYFEVINLTHKPKLVAITSCREGAGVTTTAAGLASALSETGDGNVLLVNMNDREGEAHHFYRGQLTCGLEEALEKDKRNAACVHDNLFIAKDLETNENLPRVLPKRFSHLVPKMRASDYDYIIFDMPAMSQISITPRLARYMDMVLLVVESEKTDREAAKRATNLLLESKSNVGVVLNKSRDYLPRRLQHDI